MAGRRFIRCASDHPVLKESSVVCWRHCSDALLQCSFGSSGAEGFASARLTCSLSNPPVNAPTLLFLHRRIIRCNWAFQLAFPQCTKIAPTLLHRFIRCQPDTLVPWRRIIRCLLKMQNSSISFFFWVLSSCFALLGLFTSSLRSINVHLTNLLIPLIVLLLDH